jgi:hypothetical protein
LPVRDINALLTPKTLILHLLTFQTPFVNVKQLKNELNKYIYVKIYKIY